MSRYRLSVNILAVVLFGTFGLAQTIRPPAVPLVTHDPYFSIWSMSDELNAGPTRHWTGKVQRLTGLVRIDGSVFRWMGDAPRGTPPLPDWANCYAHAHRLSIRRSGSVTGGGFLVSLASERSRGD